MYQLFVTFFRNGNFDLRTTKWHCQQTWQLFCATREQMHDIVKEEKEKLTSKNEIRRKRKAHIEKWYKKKKKSSHRKMKTPIYDGEGGKISLSCSTYESLEVFEKRIRKCDWGTMRKKKEENKNLRRRKWRGSGATSKYGPL